MAAAAHAPARVMTLTTLRTIGRIVRIDRPAVLRLGVVSIVGAALPMISIVLIHQFLATVLGGAAAGGPAAGEGSTSALWLLSGLLLLTFLASAATAYHTEVLQERFVRAIELDVMERLVRHLLSLSVPTLDRHTPGDLIEAVREDVQKLRATIVALAAMAVKLITAAALIGSAIWLSPRLSAVAFPVMLAAAFPAVLIARRVRGRAVTLRRRAYRVFDVLLQLLRGIRVIKVYRGEEAEARRAMTEVRRYFDGLVDLARLRALGAVALDMLGGFSVVIVIIVGGFEVLAGRLNWPAMLAFLVAVRATQGPIQQVNSHALHVQRNVASIDRLRALLDETPAPRDAHDAIALDVPIRRLSFEHVSFTYADGTKALEDVTFDLAHGEVLGIVGPSASGKTTLLNLTARFFDPTAGVIRVNGEDLRRYRLADVYRQLAIVTQDPFVFSTTVRENIRAGRPDARDEDVEAAARAAEIHDEIVAMPSGYETLVGAGHRGLSGGQAQRLNVARAILKNAPLLLLDEATSSLDSMAEARVQRAIARLMEGRTSLVVAHRLSTVRMATKILVLERGRAVNVGRHEELIARSALYRQMWEAQTEPPIAVPSDH
jgi:ABC-type multidrug transport system fused ATPase/permease subunit